MNNIFQEDAAYNVPGGEFVETAKRNTDINIIDIRLNSSYSNYLIDTISLLGKVDKPSLLEAGTEGVPKVKKLLDWRIVARRN